MIKYSDKDILIIINHPCQCHPYCGPACDKCIKMDYLFDNQVEDLRRLLENGVIRHSTHTNAVYGLEVVEK